MDIFAEQIVERKRRGKDFAIIAVIVLGAILLSLLLTLLLGAYSFVFVCGAWFGAYWLITRGQIEYEYIITSTVLDIDKIMAKRSRKRLFSIDLKEAERFMPIENMPATNEKVIDVTPNGIEDGVYGIDLRENGQVKRVLFKPNKKILDSAKSAAPSVVVLRSEDI